MTEATGASSALPGGTRAPGWVLAVALAAHAAFTWRFWWVTDDAYISFRFARNLALGEGLRFNVGAGPPVEGYSNFLWVVIAAGVHAFGLDVVVWMPVLSWLCGAALLALLLDRTSRVLEVPLPLAAVSVLGLACYPPFAVWSTSGLATMPFALMVFLTFDRLVLARGGPDWIRGGLFGALLALIRVEGVAWFAVVLVLALVGQVMRRELALRSLAKAGLIVAAVFGAWFAWRVRYYGEWLPNTVHTKGVSGGEFLIRGCKYVMASALTFLSPFVIVPGAFLALRPRRASIGVGVAALAWAFPVYAVVVAGDYMPMGRFLVPGLAFGTILLAWTLADLAGSSVARTRLALVFGAALGVAGALPAWDVHVLPRELRAWCNYRRKDATTNATELQRWVALVQSVEGWRLRGRMIAAYADARLEPPVSMVIRALGAISYEVDFRMLDCAGLIVPEIARREVREWKDQPGHDKAVEPSYFVSAGPTILRIGMYADAEPVRVLQRVKTDLREWGDSDSRASYRPELVEMVPEAGGPSAFLLVLVHDERVKPRMWRKLERLEAGGLAELEKVSY